MHSPYFYSTPVRTLCQHPSYKEEDIFCIAGKRGRKEGRRGRMKRKGRRGNVKGMIRGSVKKEEEEI
jgi:hypothetical protein